ncbi:MAG: ABC transporter permease subunit [Cystobacter sp.]
MNGLNEILVIWSAECQRTLRSTRALALLGLYGLFSLLIFVVAAFLRSFLQQMAESGMMTIPSEGMPLPVVVVFFVNLFFLPLYGALMGFDQVSGEVGPRSIRYLTVRARRSSVLFGKLLAQVTVLLGLVFALDLGLCVYTWLSTPGFGAGDFATYLVRFWVASAVFALAFLSLTSLCSAVTTSAPVSLLLNISALLFSLALWMTGLAEEEHPIRFLRFLSPLKYSLELLDPALSQAVPNMAAYAVFTLLFTGTALTALRTRDL